MSADRVGLLVTGIVLVGVGILFILRLGLGALRRLRDWEASAARTTATVQRHEVRTYKGNTHYLPVVRFVAPGGEEVVFEADRPRRSADPPIGYGLEVFYDPQRPSAARLPGQGRPAAFFMTIVGVLFLGVGIALIGAAWRP